MSANMIDDIQFNILRGVPARLKERTDVWQVPGIDGYGAQTLGGGDGESDLTTVVYMEDEDEADGSIADCEALQGQIVSVYDAFGIQYDDCLIKKIVSVDKKRVTYQDNEDAVRVGVKWEIVTMA